MGDMPDRIWAGVWKQYRGWAHNRDDDPWCEIAYIRADLAAERVSELENSLSKACDAIASLPDDCLGIVAETHDCPAFPIRDQLLHELYAVLRGDAQQQEKDDE